METENHYGGERFSMDWDPEYKIILITVGGNQTEEDAVEITKGFQKLINPIGPFKILVNGLDQCKSTPESRRIHVDFIKKEFKDRPGAVALCSGSIFIKMIGKFIVTVAPSAKLRIFDNVEDGMKWLKSLPK